VAAVVLALVGDPGETVARVATEHVVSVRVVTVLPPLVVAIPYFEQYFQK
jgi:hypothetical protein